MPVCGALLLLAAFLVRRLPRTPCEVSNALIERLPGWSAGFAYSMFLMTGGRLGDRLVDALVAHVSERRGERVREVPLQGQERGARRAAGRRPADLDPGALRLLGFALINYPRMLPQITRMTTGLTPDSPGFVARWEGLAREVGSWIEEAARRKRITAAE